MASEGYHEPIESLDANLRDRHRAIASIMEELEAVDWYDQRVHATADADLAAVLAHNRDEEKEHAAMVIEWLRRHDGVFDRHLRTYLFTDAPITEIEAEIEAEIETDDSDGDGSQRDAHASLDIGRLATTGTDGKDAS